ncbi:uncharacterized protein LOC141851018 [Brevipalpus obovatus]|uniref:uncharacterized protein LOC141851018 n=1 Tax=Brevipalpus obovatus TaxID=246614 RepID=UPI003D9E1619
MTIPISASSRTNSTVDKVEMNDMCTDESDELKEQQSVNDQQTERIVGRMREINDIKRRCLEVEETPIDWGDIYRLAEEILRELQMVKYFESIFLLEKDHLDAQRRRAQSARGKIMGEIKAIQNRSADWIRKKQEIFGHNSKTIDSLYEICTALANKKIFVSDEIRRMENEIEFRRDKEVKVLHELAKWKAKRAEENEVHQKDNPNAGAMDCLSKFHYMKGLIETELGEIYLKVKEHEKMVKDVAGLEEKINDKLLQTDDKEGDLKRIQQKCDELKKANNDRREKLESYKKVGDEQMRIMEDRIKDIKEENTKKLEKKMKLLDSKDEAANKAIELIKRKENAQANIAKIMKQKDMFEMLANMNPEGSDDEDLDKTVQQKRELLDKLKAKSRSNSREKVVTKKAPRTY